MFQYITNFVTYNYVIIWIISVFSPFGQRSSRVMSYDIILLLAPISETVQDLFSNLA